MAVPSALTLSADHRKHFLSTLVMLITGQSVRAGTTDPAILHLILTMLRKWLLDPGSAHLTAKELLVIIQRIAQVGGQPAWLPACLPWFAPAVGHAHSHTHASSGLPPEIEEKDAPRPTHLHPSTACLQLDRMHAIPFSLKPLWDKDFLALLYDTITQKTEDEFGGEVFNRVERTFCCGLQSADPAVRKKVGRGRGGAGGNKGMQCWGCWAAGLVGEDCAAEAAGSVGVRVVCLPGWLLAPLSPAQRPPA